MHDSFQRDRNTNKSMLATAERVAGEANFTKAQLDELTARRYQQYGTASVDEGASVLAGATGLASRAITEWEAAQ